MSITMEQHRWMRRHDELFKPWWDRFVGRPGQPFRMSWRLRVYCRVVAAHRWLWVRGFEL